RRYAAAAVVVTAVGGGITAALLSNGGGGSRDTIPPGAADTTYASGTTAAPATTRAPVSTSASGATSSTATAAAPETTTSTETTSATATTASPATVASVTTVAEFTAAEADLFQQAMQESSDEELSRPPDPPTVFGLVGNGLRRDYDSDFDGLSDFLEDHLITSFKPYYVFDEEETGCLDPFNEMEVLFQVSPETTPTTYLDTSTRVAITVVATYTADCGMFGLSALGFPEFLTHAHNGDNERIVLHVSRPHSGSDSWSIDYIDVNRHFDPVTQIRYGSGPEFPTLRNSDDWSTAVQTIGGNNRFLYLHDWVDYECCHPVLYVSESKHAAFPTVMACEFYSTKIPEKLVDKVNPISWFEDLVNGGIGLFTDKRINIYVDDWVTRYASQLTQLGIILLEDCGGGAEVFPDVPPSHNVGEVNASGLDRQAFDRMSDSESSAIRNLFGNTSRRVETTWTSTDFCGGNVRSYSGCGGSMSGKWMHTQAVRLDAEPGVTPTTEEAEEVVGWIDDVWFEHNQYVDGRNGMWVHVPLGVTNHFDDLNIRIAAFVYDLAGNMVKTTGDTAYHTSDGILTSQHIQATTAQFESSGWDQKLFLPYDQFYPGQQDYKVWVELTWEETGDTLASEWSGGTFEVSRQGMLDGVWYSDINGGWIYDMWQNPEDPTGNSYYFAPRGVGEQGIIYLDGYDISAEWSATNGSYYGSGDARIASTSNQLPSRIEWDHGGVMWRP
ncbi:MAG: hypothetical protein KJ698_04615, partial [Actinobacteria bacterium]|nr:hypothetical protein [Actinomycetota bacterium]